MSAGPLVSICLPTLNAVEFLEERLATIFAQTLQDWELICCDSHSSDGTWEKLCSVAAGDARVKCHSVPKEGLYAGWNECLRRASGRYVYVATADDVMEPDALSSLVGVLKASQQHIAVCGFYEVDAESKRLDVQRSFVAHSILGNLVRVEHERDASVEFILNLCAGPSWITSNSILFDRALLEFAGYFPTDRGTLGDVEWSAAMTAYSGVAYTPRQLVGWRRHEQQSSVKTARTVDPIKKARTRLAMAERVMRTHRSRIRDLFDNRPMLKSRLLGPRRERLCAKLGIQAGEIVRNPLRLCFSTLREAFTHPVTFPGLFCSIASSAMIGPSSLEKSVLRLISSLASPWPPIPGSDP